MSTMRPATGMLMALLVTLTVSCASPGKQVTPYDKCISLCGDELSACVRRCYRWQWSAKEVMDCVDKCNQKSTECQRQCSKLKEPPSRPMPGYHIQGGDAG